MTDININFPKFIRFIIPNIWIYNLELIYSLFGNGLVIRSVDFFLYIHKRVSGNQAIELNGWEIIIYSQKAFAAPNNGKTEKNRENTPKKFGNRH